MSSPQEQDQEVILIHAVEGLDLVGPNDHDHPDLAGALQRDGHETCVGVMKDTSLMIRHAKVSANEQNG